MNATGFRALFEGAAAARLDRVVVRLRGESPLSFLHDTSTQEVASLRPGEGALTCFLNEKGRVQAEARALALADGSVLLDAEPAARGYLTGWLARIAPLSGCELLDETEAWHVSAIRGPEAEHALGLPRPAAGEHAHAEAEGTIIVRVDWGPPGFDLLHRGSEVPDVGARAVDEATFDAARIVAGRTRFGVDITDDTFINETPLLTRAVAAQKGCYPGQESVARVQNLGRIRRHLVGITFTTPAGPSAGSPVTHEGTEAGLVTSAARTPSGAAAIAHVRAEVTDGATVEIGGAAGVVREL